MQALKGCLVRPPNATTFKRWRSDKPPAECRYDQLEETAAYEIAKIFWPDRTGILADVVGRVIGRSRVAASAEPNRPIGRQAGHGRFFRG